MRAVEYANTLTNPKGVRPFGPVAVRWSSTRKDWAATNTIEKGWNSTVHLSGKRLVDVLGRLDVRVVAIRCDEHSMFFLCEPGAVPVENRACAERVELDVIRRPGNALNVEIGSPSPRCRLKTPCEWKGFDPQAVRWLGSGGSPLVLGTCDANCPKVNRTGG